jgi:3-oxoacyl-[acyl-carrier protein] reductase
LAPFNINVNAILPGPIRTEFWNNLTKNASDLASFWNEISKGIPLQRYGLPEDVAGVALCLASDLFSFVTGALIPVSGGIPIPVYVQGATYNFSISKF